MSNVITKYLLEQGELIAQTTSYGRAEKFNKTLEAIEKERPNWVTRIGYFKKLIVPNKIEFNNVNKEPYPITLSILPTLDVPKENIKYEILFTIGSEDDGKLLSYIEIEEP